MSLVRKMRYYHKPSTYRVLIVYFEIITIYFFTQHFHESNLNLIQCKTWKDFLKTKKTFLWSISECELFPKYANASADFNFSLKNMDQRSAPTSTFLLGSQLGFSKAQWLLFWEDKCPMVRKCLSEIKFIISVILILYQK